LRNCSAELFHERLGRNQLGKTPPKIDLIFSNNSSSMPRLNFSRPVKVHHPAAKFDIQFIAIDDKLDNVRILILVCDRFPVSWHVCDTVKRRREGHVKQPSHSSGS
jgi:hypothetical protein